MDVVRIGQIALVMVLPSLFVGAVLCVPGGIRLGRRLVARRHVEVVPRATRPPIEQLAADLRRLLERHELRRRSVGKGTTVLSLRALEGAIAEIALDLAGALGLPSPVSPGRDGLSKRELRRLLQALVAAGLVLPPAIGLLDDDRRS